MTTKTIREIALAWKSDKQRYVKQRQISCNIQNDKKMRVNANIYSIYQAFDKVYILLFICYFTI